ncbi:MAG: MGMT family protein [Methanoregula sp.]|nr:MAG: MGMT family protein [Methanoregula sp.]
MEVNGGSCRFGLWYVHVWWSGNLIHRVRFSKTGIPGPVPAPFLQYCAGLPVDLSIFKSIARKGDTLYAKIYRAVQDVPYGSQATYGEIALIVGTAPRVIGRAMMQNPTPLVVPCHRIIGARGLGGFTPDIEIKEALLAMEKKGLQKK